MSVKMSRRLDAIETLVCQIEAYSGRYAVPMLPEGDTVMAAIYKINQAAKQAKSLLRDDVIGFPVMEKKL